MIFLLLFFIINSSIIKANNKLVLFNKELNNDSLDTLDVNPEYLGSMEEQQLFMEEDNINLNNNLENNLQHTPPLEQQINEELEIELNKNMDSKNIAPSHNQEEYQINKESTEAEFVEEKKIIQEIHQKPTTKPSQEGGPINNKQKSPEPQDLPQAVLNKKLTPPQKPELSTIEIAKKQHLTQEIQEIKNKINIIGMQHQQNKQFLAKLLLFLKINGKFAKFINQYYQKHITNYIKIYFLQILKLDNLHQELKIKNKLLQKLL